MTFRGLLISCSECGRPVESVVYSPRARDEGFRGHWPFADAHKRVYGHYPRRGTTIVTRGRVPQNGAN